ncbi:MAG TPA: von Willebrand factor type A domain-containing protein [Chitinophagaceae bacterium]|nr:von Willebrand factor type A domain-containing protein [Chitinophagaceae bacterium]
MKLSIALVAVIAIVVVFFSFTTPRTVTGTVTDENNNAIAGATVAVKGTKTATATDSKGAFNIIIPGDYATLVISSVGYDTKEVRAGTSSSFTIQLKPSTQELSDVVVTTGLEIAKRKNIEYSMQHSISGKAAGVYVQSESKPLYNLIPPDKEAYEDSDDAWRYNNNFNTEEYDHIVENPFLKVKDNPLSTFSIDVDAASYSNVRRFINDGQLPPAGAVLIEEMIKYFSYNYPQPKNDEPFSVNTEMASCPWNEKHKLVLVGLQGKILATENLPASNLVFLIDVSGSMMDENKLPLVQQSMKLLVDQLRPQDKVAMVVYAGNAGLVLPSTNGDNKMKIKDAIDRLEAGGSTAGGEGIKLAYKTAKENFIKSGNNRIILCTDGDFNVGVSSDDALQTLIEKERESGVFLTVLGYGMGNYKDSKMEILADKGNGNHAYIDQLGEAKKVLVNEFGGTLFTIAKDVKLQIEFNPSLVQSYRLIGYENRMLAKEDFNNDKKDAGELGSGHTVTALYEVVPAGVQDDMTDSVDALRYQHPPKKEFASSFGNEIMNIKLRYKKPDGDISSLIQHPLNDENKQWASTSANFRFAAAVAEFGMLLRDSKYKGSANMNAIVSMARDAMSDDKEGYRKEFLQLVQNTAILKAKEDNAKAK